jgi:secreted PhoX family phosphatase
MSNTRKFIMVIIIIIAVLFLIGIIWTSIEINTNMERKQITDSCSVELPKDVEFNKTGGSDANGTFINLTSNGRTTWGRMIVDYEQSDNITSGQNQTKALTGIMDKSNIYKCWVYDLKTHQKVEVLCDNPSKVEEIARTVRFS